MFSLQAVAQSTQPPVAGSSQLPQPEARRGADGNLGGIAPGGITLADFAPLIDLVQGSIVPEGWEEAGGEASIQPYVQGVFADAEGTLKFELAKKGKRHISPKPSDLKTRPTAVAGDARQSSDLRFVSLPRLESALEAYIRERKALPPEMLTLAGLQRIQYVLVVPAIDGQVGDLILAGPAGDWRAKANGMIVSQNHGQPVVRIDDLLTLWRRPNPNEPFGVTINPTESGLAAMQEYLTATTAKPIKRSKRKAWVEGIRESIGKQSVQFFDLQPDSHVAKTLLTADYHMKCIGMGVAEPVEGVESYLDSVTLDAEGKVPPMSVLRWWFAMNYQPVTVSDDNQVYELRGVGAKVLSENQLLAARGKRIATGKSEDLNKRFASSFSKQFGKICQQYPIYGELRNVFDLSMTLALIEKQSLLDRSGWQPGLLLDSIALQLPKVRVAAEVDTIANHRVIDKKTIVAGVSGGVWVDSKKHLATQPFASMPNDLAEARPADLAADEEGQPIVWWWDRP
jgi:hypothetical protein